MCPLTITAVTAGSAADSALGSLHRVYMGSPVDVSEVHVASIFYLSEQVVKACGGTVKPQDQSNLHSGNAYIVVLRCLV